MPESRLSAPSTPHPSAYPVVVLVCPALPFMHSCLSPNNPHTSALNIRYSASLSHTARSIILIAVLTARSQVWFQDAALVHSVADTDFLHAKFFF